MPDLQKSTGAPDESGKDFKKVGEIKITIPLSPEPEEEEQNRQANAMTQETEITRKPTEPATPKTSAPTSLPAKPEATPAATTLPSSKPSPAPSISPPPPGPTPPKSPPPAEPAQGTPDRPPLPAPPQPAGSPSLRNAETPAPIQPSPPLQPLPNQPEESGLPEGGQSGSAQADPAEQRQQALGQGLAQAQAIEAVAELSQEEAARKAQSARQIQSAERAAGRAHLLELIAQSIVEALDFFESLLKLLGNVAKPIPILGIIVQIIVWVFRGIIIMLKFLPKGVAKGERKDEDRLRAQALKLRAVAGIKTPRPPDNPHGAAETPPEGLTGQNVRAPVLNLVAPKPEAITILPGLLKIQPPLSGILKIFVIAGGAVLLLISLSGMITLMRSSGA